MNKSIRPACLAILMAIMQAWPLQAGSAGAEEKTHVRSETGSDGSGVGNVKAAPAPRLSDTVVLSARSLPKGHRLREGDIYLAQVENARIPEGALREADEAVGKRLSRSIGPNLPIREPMLQETKEVKRGRRVTLVAEADGLRISAPGETLENSRIDGYVKVVNMSSKKTVTGRLVDEGTVRVDFR